MACPACGQPRTEAFFSAPRAPVFCNVLSPTAEAARAVPGGEIRLEFCPPAAGGCSLIFNSAFDESLLRYSGTYENALHFSPVFQRYADDLARDLVDRHAIRGKRIIEIGCGDASFLAALCRLGGSEGIGFDPAHDPARAQLTPGARVRIVPELYSPATAHLAGGPPDLLLCRHTLEHVPRPREFLAGVRRAVGDAPKTAVFFEVPDMRWTLQQLGIWDILYEHCLYFTAGSLWSAFERAGFVPRRCGSVYGGQFLTIEASPPGAAAESPIAAPTQDDIPKLVAEFGRRYAEKVAAWRHRLTDLAGRGERAVLWGAGTKGVMFLNTMGPAAAAVAAVVDVNPRKHGHFIAGTAQPIIAPGSLAALEPSVVVIMNPLYRDEIQAQLDQLGVRAAVEAA